MRTTVDLPDELIRAAKARAAERGETLKELFTRLLAREVKSPASTPQKGRVSLPLIGDAEGTSVVTTNADLEAALTADDAERYGH
ncbi:hypothetical protein [Phytoactinopolyspora mesophila]|uniref:Antitoxin n=1 Tax=Phytoactinopolyspora mesophila TaxID=2650750 RepID=A0A7K3LZG4_9ACTN|nr:hypothetical protein [Phytoactinopolyspora mesophila]NDL56423.1 hypothetical protein [Phytoactinopolyspora mesophila]